MNNTAVIIGAGFSSEAGVPLTSEINKGFTDCLPNQTTPEPIQSEITRHLWRFWQDVFNTKRGGRLPSFEDHFTVLDLAANSGHNLGPYYTPAHLRAIRRLSIHRVFDILDQFKESASLRIFLDRLAMGRNNTVISVNWDVIVENHLRLGGHGWDYGIPMCSLTAEPEHRTGRNLLLLKLQGSSNWLYCDSCRRVYSGPPSAGKIIRRGLIFLEERDFEILGSPLSVIDEVKRRKVHTKCKKCKTQLTARVATFSFSKAYDFFQFQSVWARALKRLIDAQEWLFIGYSLPEADYEIRHMVKTAQLASPYGRKLRITVVTKRGEAARRYMAFFGMRQGEIHQKGFKEFTGM